MLNPHAFATVIGYVPGVDPPYTGGVVAIPVASVVMTTCHTAAEPNRSPDVTK